MAQERYVVEIKDPQTPVPIPEIVEVRCLVYSSASQVSVSPNVSVLYHSDPNLNPDTLEGLRERRHGAMVTYDVFTFGSTPRPEERFARLDLCHSD